MYRLAIFDLDGTILDTLDDLAASINYALAQADFPTRTTAEVKSFVGNGIRRLVELSVPESATMQDRDGVYETFTAHYKQHCADNTKPYIGVIQLLADLRAQGYLTAVVSNKADFAVQELCAQYFGGLFDAAIGEREGIRRKPYPDSVEEVLHRLAVSRAEAVYIGDSEVDIATARNASMDCIIVDWGFREREYLREMGAREIVSSCDELFARLVP